MRYPGDPGLLVMLLLITEARCLSEDWLGIKQRAHASTFHISSFCFQRLSLPSGAWTVHALLRAAPLLQSSAEVSHIQYVSWPPYQQIWPQPASHLSQSENLQAELPVAFSLTLAARLLENNETREGYTRFSTHGASAAVFFARRRFKHVWLQYRLVRRLLLFTSTHKVALQLWSVNRAASAPPRWQPLHKLLESILQLSCWEATVLISCRNYDTEIQRLTFF